MAIRKDANTLTAAERTEFVTAVLELKPPDCTIN